MEKTPNAKSPSGLIRAIENLYFLKRNKFFNSLASFGSKGRSTIAKTKMNFLRRRVSESDDEDDDRAQQNNRSSKIKSRKPPNTAFRQQRLKAWQPILTPKSVIPLLFVLAVIFAPLGIGILNTVYNVQLVQVDYSQCGQVQTDSNNDFQLIPSKYTQYHFQDSSAAPDFKWKLTNGTDLFDDLQQTCTIQFSVPKDIKGPIYLYYKLTNFFQNHRKYVQSFDINQLKGVDVAAGSLNSYCSPLQTVGGKAIYPCGLIANSLFNDTFSSPKLLNAQLSADFEVFNMSETGISWKSDRTQKFKKTTYDPSQIAPPPNWYKMFPQGYNATNVPDLSQWEHLQNWMRTAGLPSFYKLYLQNKNETLLLGIYEIDIVMNYPVEIFGGTKSIVLTTNSIFGGRHLSLGVIYIIVAIVCLVLGIAFLLQHLIKPRRIGDHNYLHNNPANNQQLREAL